MCMLSLIVKNINKIKVKSVKIQDIMLAISYQPCMKWNALTSSDNNLESIKIQETILGVTLKSFL